MQKPSYTLNNSSLFFGLNEVDFMGLGFWFLVGLYLFKDLEGFKYLPFINILVSSISLILFRLKFRRHTVRDLLSYLFTKKVIHVS